MKLVKVIPLCLILSMFLFQPEVTLAMPGSGDHVSDWFEQDEGDEGDEQTVERSENEQNDQQPAIVDDNQGQEADQIGQSNRSLFLDFLRMFVALILVLGLIYFLLKFLQKRSRIYQQSQSLENVGGISLGSNKSAQVVRVGNEYYLLGVGDDVQMLTKIDDPETIEKMTDTGELESKPNTFQSLLQSFQNRNRNPYQEQETKRQFQTELESMKQARHRMTKRYQDRNDRNHD
ncbi:flagellar biosynthetic protein FliO [Alkalibacillus aidingensis]|uniref:flagellar biosynthetic protein FliO n=1 Tax=Alkalibacillus aidingensis TaxID=2747607 RepID=UPI001660D2A3|nr:flagellar biosynthetic protein FliO [Alkalibacillus aidingensis]